MTTIPPFDELRAAAEAAIAGDERAQAPGTWEPYFTTHGDPFVVEEGRGQFGVVATVSTHPEDYGRARAQFIAMADPNTVIALLDLIANQQREIRLRDRQV